MGFHKDNPQSGCGKQTKSHPTDCGNHHRNRRLGTTPTFHSLCRSGKRWSSPQRGIFYPKATTS